MARFVAGHPQHAYRRRGRTPATRRRSAAGAGAAQAVYVLIARGMETVEYAAGRLADVPRLSPPNPRFCCGTASSPTHARQCDQLTELIAGHGLGW